MIKSIQSSNLSTSCVGVAWAVSAAVLSGASQAPAPTAYVANHKNFTMEQITGTFSSYQAPSASVMINADKFVEEVASMYASLAERQVSLGSDIEALIFENLEELYEA